jgi:hypothetical protein
MPSRSGLESLNEASFCLEFFLIFTFLFVNMTLCMGFVNVCETAHSVANPIALGKCHLSCFHAE